MRLFEMDIALLALIGVILGAITIGLNLWSYFDAMVDLKALERDSPNEARCIIARSNRRNEGIRLFIQIDLIIFELLVFLAPDPGLPQIALLVNFIFPILGFVAQGMLSASSVLDRRDRRRLMGIAPSPSKAATGASPTSTGSTPDTHTGPGDSLG